MKLRDLLEDILRRMSEISKKKLRGYIQIEVSVSDGGIATYKFGFKETIKGN